ncbi:MAG: lytic murein transglycosylase B [Herbaspirillum sp.]
MNHHAVTNRSLLTLILCASLAACSSVTLTPPAPVTTPVAPTVAPAPIPASVAAPVTAPSANPTTELRWPHSTEFIDQMVSSQGFDRATLQQVFEQLQYQPQVVQLMRPAPVGKPKNWNAYRARFVEPIRINAGVRFWNQYAEQLTRAEAQYGVPAEIIVAIIGVETVYGRNTGNFRVMDAIATLAFDYPDTPNRDARMRYFRGELENTLLFARQSNIDPLSLRGSYAGAIGWPQFMPGSILKYAVDGDGDGRIDLRNSPADAISSVANFLVQHGWKTGAPIVFPAKVSSTNADWQAFIGQGLKAGFPLAQLKANGVLPQGEPTPSLSYGLVDLQNGRNPTEYWLGTDNFFVITQYNRSYFYAMAVVELSRAVRQKRGN